MAIQQTALSLLQGVCFHAGISGMPTTTQGLTGMQARAYDWIDQAWLAIQRDRNDWEFMHFDCTFNTSQGVWQVPAATVVGSTVNQQWNTLTNGPNPIWLANTYDPDTFRIYDTNIGVSGMTWLGWMDWKPFRDLYRFGAISLQQSRPVRFSRHPTRDLVLGFVPDNGSGAGYTIQGMYYASPQSLKVAAAYADTWVPPFPIDYHELIMWEAIKRYAGFDETSAAYTHADNMAQPIWDALIDAEFPSFEMGPPLA